MSNNENRRNLGDALPNLTDSIAEDVRDIGHRLTHAADKGRDKAHEGIDKTRRNMDDRAHEADRHTERASEKFQEAKDNVRDGAHDLGNRVRETADDIGTGAKERAAGARESAERTGDDVRHDARNLADRAGEAVEGGAEATSHAAGVGVGKTQSALDSAKDRLNEFGDRVKGAYQEGVDDGREGHHYDRSTGTTTASHSNRHSDEPPRVPPADIVTNTEDMLKNGHPNNDDLLKTGAGLSA